MAEAARSNSGRSEPGRAETNRADAFDALADPQRRTILSMLVSQPSSVQQLADQLPISRPAVSRHLRLLSEAGLVQEERVGTRHIFSLQEQGLEAVRTYLERLWGDAATRFTLFAENTGGESSGGAGVEKIGAENSGAEKIGAEEDGVENEDA